MGHSKLNLASKKTRSSVAAVLLQYLLNTSSNFGRAPTIMGGPVSFTVRLTEPGH